MAQSSSFAWAGLLPEIVSRMPADSRGNAFEIVATASGIVDAKAGIRNLGPLMGADWSEEVAKSKFLVRCRENYMICVSVLISSWVSVGRTCRHHVSASRHCCCKRLTYLSAYDALCFGELTATLIAATDRVRCSLYQRVSESSTLC